MAKHKTRPRIYQIARIQSGDVVVLRTESQEALAEFRKQLNAIGITEVLLLGLPENGTLQVLKEEQMNRCGWYRYRDKEKE